MSTDNKDPNIANSQPGSSFEERLAALEKPDRLWQPYLRDLATRLAALEDRIVPDNATWSDLTSRLVALEKDGPKAWDDLNTRLSTVEKTAATPDPISNDELTLRVGRLEDAALDPAVTNDLSLRLARIEEMGLLAAATVLSPQQLMGIQSSVLNLANIFLRTGNHEVRTAIKEIARGLCFVIGQQHSVFFPDAPNSRQVPEPNAATVLPGAPGPGFPAAAQAGGMPAAMAAHAAPTPPPGIAVPGMPPSPFAIPSRNDPQGASHPVTGSPAGPGVSPQGAPGECRMEVVSDPAGQMGPNGGPPAGTPGLPGHAPMPAQPAGVPIAPVPGAPVPGMPGGGVHPVPQAPPAGGEAPAVTLDQLAAQFSPMGGDS